MKFRLIKCFVLTVAASLAFADHASAKTYKFKVSCPDWPAKVEEWKIGSIDPGREYLRVITGTRNPSCSISDFNARTDADLPVETHKDAEAVLSGLPPVAIIRSVFGF